ncbi:MAG: BlaI/MecI/CopY family transcriptional regulator [Acidobacteriota bacterium]
MSNTPPIPLSRREREIMDVLFKHGRATAAEVQAGMPDPPSYSAVRAMLRTLEDKGHIRHQADGPRYVYSPTIAKDKAKRSALRHLVETFFGGSVELAVAALLDGDARKLSADELARLETLVRNASPSSPKEKK